MDDVKLTWEDRPLLCTSLQWVINVDNEHKDKSPFGFKKNKRRKKGEKMQEKMVEFAQDESDLNKQEAKGEKPPSIYGNENQCGNSVDIEV